MKLRIKNFRSLKDTHHIDIKPITILIGKNSSGKSTFLRAFPMLRQSVEEKTRSPILLYGNYVDFGSYKDIKPHFTKNKSDDKFELSFTFDTDLFKIVNRRRSIFSTSKNLIFKEFENITFSATFEDNRRQLLQISEVRFDINDYNLSISFDHEKKLIKHIFVNYQLLYNQDDNIKFEDKGEFYLDLFIIKKRAEFVEHRRFINVIKENILKIISTIVSNKTSIENRSKIFDNLDLTNDIALLNSIQEIQLGKKFRNTVSSWDISDQTFIDLRNHLVLHEFINNLYTSVNLYLNNTFSKVKYIAPLRATAERYYRMQHLAINEVDSNGKNLPFFLDSLSEKLMEDFQSWTSENFNFKVNITKIEGHYSIKILHDENIETNLSDMGFGYSQILPILTQIWYSSIRREEKFNSPYVRMVPTNIVIEQPELHLHPEFQAKFADALCKIISYTLDKRVKLNIIIETHSDIIINRLGDNILSGTIESSQINIVIFYKKD
ncbi:AAA family ATPase [Flavobacterium coralii]|uniref:AAA family ATPase n=1 Tax=Flavobacterium coralii TaxID=2838017 RepID=UPI000C3BD8EB|nr:hypothetical protein [Flavobacterium sp.]|tara:strand:- start:2202 stop:3683 length:1482 start_codon:yes stop_codon:yes gene_type:complete